MGVNRTCRVWLLAVLTAVVSTIWTTPSFGAPAPVIASVPAAPTVSARTGFGRVVLDWPRVPDAREYRVFRSTNGTFDATPFARVPNSGFLDFRVTNGRTYSYRVVAVNRAGAGPMSNIATAKPLAPPEVVTAEPGDGKATVRWRASLGAAQYILYRGQSWDRAAMVPVATLPGLEFVDTGLANGTVYFYRVRAIDGTNQSRLSPYARVKPAAPPTPAPTVPPANLTGALVDGKAQLAWSAVPGATGYKIFRSTSDGFTLPSMIGSTAALHFTDTGMAAGTAYFYKVAAYNAGGIGPMSNIVSVAPVPPPPAPAGLAATVVEGKIKLTWSAVAGVTGYKIFRGSSDAAVAAPPVGTTALLTLTDTTVTLGTTYFYKVASYNANGTGPMSTSVNATPAALPAAPTGLMATPGNAMVTLTWTPVAGAMSYRVYRGTAAGAQSATAVATGLTTSAFVDSGLVNGAPFFYKVTAVGAGGEGPRSSEASATPVAPLPAPTGLTATAGNGQVSLSWATVTGAASYSLYRGTATGAEGPTPIATGILTPDFIDNGLTNGLTYFYQVTAVNSTSQSARSAEANATPTSAAPVASSTLETFRFLRQATWGPKPGDIAALAPLGASGREAFIAQQFGAAPSIYPDTLYDQGTEVAQEHFMGLALTGQDQLRQRVAWALHKIWVVSAVEVSSTRGIVTYHRLLLNNAFGNYRDLMFNVTVNPAMGRYLNMLNSRRQNLPTDPLPNENYARELMQLFTLGLTQVNPNGTPTNPASPQPTYSEDDVKALARILTGWTFGDGNPATVPTSTGGENYTVPMEAVASRHDVAAKTFLGQNFPAGGTALAELNRALDIIFSQSSLAPFVSRQLIQQLVTSNPSQGYVQDITAVFNDNGGGVKGDLAAVVKAILLHSEALASNDPNTMNGKLAEPVLYITSMMRAFNATVTDHPFMTDRSEVMGQRVFYPPSVFSYFAPGFRVRGTSNGLGVPLQGPEFQGLTTVTALERANFVGTLLRGDFGTNVTIDYSPFTTRATTAATLVDYCAEVFLGGRISAEHRNAIVNAVNASGTDAFERSRTAIYLILTSAQAQVDR